MAAKSKKAGNIVLYILFALLIFSLGGFGVANFGGTVRSIGAVGDTEISVNDYALALRNAQIRAQIQGRTVPPISTPQGEAFALSIRTDLFARAALEEETAQLGLSVGDERVRLALLDDPNFQGLGGSFDRAAYNEALRRIGMKESEYEASLRARTAADLTSAAVIAGLQTHETMIDIIAEFTGERRDIAWLKLDASAIEAPLPAPTEAELQAVYEADPEAYTSPEMRAVTYAALTPEMVLDKISIDDAELQALYDERSDEYNRPERRLVERLVFPDMDSAEAAKDAADGGVTFESLVQGRGLTLVDVDMGDVAKEDLNEAGDAVFAADGPGIVGPIDTSLGPALYRINAILAPEVTEFDEVRDDLADELQRERAGRYIDGLRDEIDDLLAAGATLEELAQETEMELGTLTVGPDTAEGMAAYPAFRETVQATNPGDFPDLISLNDGALLSLRVDEVIAPALQPLDDVRDQVTADWEAQETTARLGDLGEEIRAARLEGQSFEELGYTPEIHTDLARESFLDGAPEDAIESVFKMKDGDVISLAEGGVLHLIEVTKITPLEDTDADIPALRDRIGAGLLGPTAENTLSLFLGAIQAKAGISRNQAAINTVHANLP